MNSHYIPQFILKGFCNDNKQLIYCDFDKSATETRNTKSVFSTEGYYPDQVEKDLCLRMELPFANLYHNKIETAKDSLVLSQKELFLLKKFLIVSSLRYKYYMTENDKALLERIPKEYQHLYRINSIEAINKIIDIENDDELSKYLERVVATRHQPYNKHTDKADFNLQIFMDGREAYYNDLVFLRANDKEEFVIPDIGRAFYMANDPIKNFCTKMLFAESIISNHPKTQLIDKLTPRDYTFYPLSKSLALLSISPFYKEVLDRSEEHKQHNTQKLSKALGFSENKILESFAIESNGEYHVPVVSICDSDILHFNALSINQAKHFIACSDLSKIQESVNTAKSKSKRDLSFLVI